jgi:hypothetical protein
VSDVERENVIYNCGGIKCVCVCVCGEKFLKIDTVYFSTEFTPAKIAQPQLFVLHEFNPLSTTTSRIISCIIV